MDTLRKPDVEVSAAEPNEEAHWQEVFGEITARLKKITRNVKYVLAQEGLADQDDDSEQVR